MNAAILPAATAAGAGNPPPAPATNLKSVQDIAPVLSPLAARGADESAAPIPFWTPWRTDKGRYW